jgi:hypothetical protein
MIVADMARTLTAGRSEPAGESKSERLAAWEQVGPYLLANLDAAVTSLSARIVEA